MRFEYTRAEEFFTGRSRHPMRIRMKTGVSRDGRIIANEMYALSDTGAYGCHALTVTGNTGHKSMALYNAPHIRFYADIVYTNTPPAGAFRGYGVPQGAFAVDAHIERIAREMGFDPFEFRLKNAVKPGDEHPFSRVWSEGRAPVPEIIKTCGLEDCVRKGAEAIGWHQHERPEVARDQHEAWELVQRSHAVTNGVFVAAVNRVGREGDVTFWGTSFVAAPDGQLLARAAHHEEGERRDQVHDADLLVVRRAEQPQQVRTLDRLARGIRARGDRLRGYGRHSCLQD